jgi:hypothetical protein
MPSVGQGSQHAGDGAGHVGRHAAVGHGRAAEAGQVDRVHVVVAGQVVEHRLPGLPPVADAVERARAALRSPAARS